MADIFWNKNTPTLSGTNLSAAYVPLRVQGTAADGSLDTFAQVSLANAANVSADLLFAVLSSLPDIANGDVMPASGLYWNAGVLCRVS